jgi:hypothetical protein
MTNSQSKEIQPIIVPFKYIPEGVWEHIKSYAISKQDHPYEQCKKVFNQWFEEIVKPKSKKDVAVVLQSLIDSRDNTYIDRRITQPETTQYKRTTKDTLLSFIFMEVKHRLTHSLCVWDTQEERWEQVNILEISPAKMTVAKTIFNIMKTQIKEKEETMRFIQILIAFNKRTKLPPN